MKYASQQIVGAELHPFVNNWIVRRGNLKTLGQRIKKLRKQRGLLQVDLAVRVGISTGYVGSIEQGLRYPSLKVLEKIARHLKVKTNQLLP